MIRRLALSALLTAILGGAALADKPPAIELGFKPDKVYSFGSLDNVNLFNGNMVFNIPLGMKYPVSSRLSYGLTLVYNSKAWDYFYVENATDPSDIRAWAKPNVRSNAGMGWRVSLGRLIPPSAFTSTSGYAELDDSAWVYESPAGDEHNVADRNSSATVTVSNDGSYLRMKVVSSTVREIQFPNGEVHTFTLERNSWRLTKMADAFANAMNVAYAYDGTSSRTTTWTITDAFNRTHTISFINSPYLADTEDRGQMVSSITMRGIGVGTTNVTYTFNYSMAASVAYGCEHNMPVNNANFSPSPTSTRATVPLLTSVTLPNGSKWSFDYYLDDLVAGDCSSGLLKDVTLPTLGKMSYTYQTYTIPANDWCTLNGPSNSSAGVKTRTVDGDVWTYVQTIGPIAHSYIEPGFRFVCGPDSPDGEQGSFFPQPAHRWKRTSVIAPPHNGTARSRSDHYFSLWRDTDTFQDTAFDTHNAVLFQYGYPTVSAWPGQAAAKLAPVAEETAPDVSAKDAPADPAPRFLESQVWTGCAASGSCSTGTLLQSQYSRTAFFGTLRHASSERTVYEDDSGCTSGKCFAQADYADHDGVGNLRQVVASGNFKGAASSTSRTEYVGWTSAEIADPNRKWVTTRYTEKSRSVGSDFSRTLYCFGSAGELQRTRALKNGTSESTTAGDLLETYTYSSGNVTSIRSYGGDFQTLSAGVCNSDVTNLTPRYRTDYSWSWGGLGSEWPVDTSTGLAMLFRTQHYTRNSSTGLVTQSRSTDGLITAYGYTAWGAISSVKPPGELETAYAYANATTTAKAKVTATRSDAQVIYEYDGMGRLVREQKSLPGAGCVHRKLTYDAFDRVANETSWHGCSAASPGSTTYTYDALGRTTSVTAPDGKTTFATYTGARLVTRVANVAGVTGSSDVAISEENDRFGRLIEVRENAAASVPEVTTYEHDEGDRLTKVSMSGQERVFTYDGRGFLTSEKHPELAGGTTVYRDFDARGHATRRTTGPDNGVFDVRYTFDPAERVTTVRRVSDSRLLKELAYDDPEGTYGCDGDSCRGKLAASARYHWDSDLSNTNLGEALVVTEAYKYNAINGRPSRRDRAIGNTSLFTGNSFYFAQFYNDIGAVSSIHYPCSDIAGCPDNGLVNFVDYEYKFGELSSAGTFAESITYAPSGIIDTVKHGATGAAGSEVWTRDPWGMPRPQSIAAKSGTITHWTSGNYAYDGAGNISAIGTTSYHYDQLGRLAQWKVNNADGSSTWTGREYDRYGNPLRGISGLCGVGGAGCSSTTGATRQVAAGTTNRYTDTTYDAAGNVTADPSGRSFTFDSLGLMSRAQISGRQFRYLYTADDERIAAVEKLTISGATKFRTTYTIRGFRNELLSTWRTDPTTNVASWVEDEVWRGASLLARVTPTTTQHYFLDHLGSARAITSTGGALIGTQNFDPWGSGGTSNGGAIQFTGHERDAANFGTGNALFPDYMHARFYEVGGGRFLSMDPGRDWDLRWPQSWNMYAYVRNNPLNFVDPTGGCGEPPEFVGPTQPCDMDFWMHIEVTADAPRAPGAGGAAIGTVYDFSNRDEAATAAIQAICGESVQRDREFGGMVFESDGRFAYSTPIMGGAHDVSNAFGAPNFIDAAAHMLMLPPPGARMVGTYHTHGAESGRADESISDNDRRSSFRLGLAGYVGTPTGRVLRYDPKQEVLRDPYKYDFGQQIGAVPCR